MSDSSSSMEMKIRSNRTSGFAAAVVALVLSAGISCAATYYVGGDDPGGGRDWLPGTWGNFLTQVGKLSTSGDVLRVAGTITRTNGNDYVTLGVDGTVLSGGWDGASGVEWSRLDLNATNNRSVLDGASLGCLMEITGSNIRLEGVWLKRGCRGSSDPTLHATNLRVVGTGAMLDYCCFTDATLIGGIGAGTYSSVFVGTNNVTIRRSLFDNNEGLAAGNIAVGAGVNNTRITETIVRNTVSYDSGLRRTLYLNQKAGNTVTIDNSLFHETSEVPIFINQGTMKAINVTFSNVRMELQNDNAAVMNFGNSILDNAHFYASSSSAGTGQATVTNSLVHDLTALKSNLIARLNFVADTQSLDIDTGNPPMFTDHMNGVFSIESGSAAVNLGTNSLLALTYQGEVLGVSAGLQTDLARRQRIRLNRVDAGAFEKQPANGTVITLK